MKYLTIITYCILLFISENLNGQYYDTGQDPAKLKWLQINTGRFKVIYPEVYGSQGIKFARELEKSYSELTTLFPEKKFKLPVIIHNFTTQSNGYVAWAPKRMELYPTPEQNSIPLDPDRQLALHEMTHVMQMEMLNTGFSRVMSYIAGQQFTGAVSALLPLWYMEGNAVFSETVFSESGRGRSPDFQKELKAMVIEKGRLYKYDKMLDGSWKDYTPDYYQFGYQMVTWSMAKNGLQLWNKALKFTGGEPFTLNPVNISLRKNAGLTKKKLFDQTFDSLKTIWTKDLERNNAVKYESLNPSKKGKFINYYSPVIAGKDSVIAVKTSLSSPSSFVLFRPSDKSEKTLHVPGSIYPRNISYAKGNLVWVETVPDPRWENRNYSVIKLKNIRTGITKQLTFRSRYLAASISPDGRNIVASENSVDNRNSLVILNVSDGTLLKTIPAPENASLQRPQWSGDAGKITVIYLTEAGEGIMSYALADNSWHTLIKADRNDLQSSFLRNDSLFYISSYSGTDNIYLLAEGKGISQVTRSRFSANDMNVSGSSIIFSDYTAQGNDVCMTSVANIRADEFHRNNQKNFLLIVLKPIR